MAPMDDVTRSELKRVEERVNVNARNITKLWDEYGRQELEIKSIRETVISDYKTHVHQVETRAKEHTESRVREALLQMNIDSQKFAKEVAKEIKGDIKTQTGWVERLKDNIVNYVIMAAIGALFFFGNADAAIVGKFI